MTRMEVVPLRADSEDLDALVARSHQTSLYVTREWREAFPSAAIYGAYTNDELSAAIFVEASPLPMPFVGYRGLLLSRREQVAIANRLIAAAEKVPHATVWNAPSLVDLRPFFWRYPSATWRADVRYTLFLDRNCRPYRPLEIVEFEQADDPGECPIEWTYPGFDVVSRLSSTLTYRSETATLMVGVDPQDRAYVIAGWGPRLDDLTWSVASLHPTLDLGGANSPTMASKKRVFGGHLRTAYKVFI